MTDRPIISIVIPAYNAEKTIGRTLKSLVNQTFVDFEIIVIDDGSDDRTYQICTEYQSLVNIIIYKQRNAGVSRARNRGIEIAQGEWLTFIDADDEVRHNYLEELINATHNGNIDIVISGVSAVSSGKSKSITIPDAVFNGDNRIREFIEGYLGHPLLKVNASKLYRCDILKKQDIRYDQNIRLSEDALFVLQYLLYVKGIAVVSDSSYIYYQPTCLEFKYSLSLEEAVYKCETTENALKAIEERFNCSLKNRIEQNWHKSLGCIALEDYLDEKYCSKIQRLFVIHCSSFSLDYDLQCNVMLKCLYQLSCNSEMNNDLRLKAIRKLYDKELRVDYIINRTHPKKLLFIRAISKMCSPTMLFFFSKLISRL